VSITSAGYDNLNTNDMKARGIRVGLAGSAITNATAELALTLLLAASRKLVPLSSQYKRWLQFFMIFAAERNAG
jgi:lactate dehydrogenase-like 2-hydroxyacid dehydrogenase